MNANLKRVLPTIKLSKTKSTKYWNIEVDNGDSDATLTTSTTSRERALMFALAIAGISVEISGPGYLYQNISTEPLDLDVV